MNWKFKYRWSVMASSIILAFFSFGVGGNAKADSSSTNVQTPVSTQTTSASSSSASTIDNSSLHTGESSQWSLESSSQSSSSNSDKAAVPSWNSVDPAADANSSSDSSSSSASGGTTTTYGNADDNNVNSSSSSATDTASSSTPSSEPMLGLGDKGSAGAGTDADKVVKSIINRVVPGGGLDNTKPDVSGTAASSSSQSDPAGTATNATANGQSAGNQQSSTGVIGQAANQTAIEQPKAANAIAHNSFANRVSKSDADSPKKNTTKLVSFDTYSNIFYKQALSKRNNPGKFTTSKGKKVTITTPVSNVKYSDHDVNGVVETLPVIITLSIIGIVALSFIVFDPLRFIFR